MTAKTFRTLVTLCLALLIAAPAAVRAQEVSLTTPELIPDYQIGPGDVLSLQVFGLRDFDQRVRVSNSGRIHVPYIGVVFVGGMTAVGLERDIARIIAEQGLMNDPQVRVSVEQHNARPVYVIGEVTMPGQFVLTGETYLLDLIGKAGGLLPSADDTGIVYRRLPAQPGTQRLFDQSPTVTLASSDVTPQADAGSAAPGENGAIPVNFEELRQGARSDLNVRLQGGDVVFVPRRPSRNFWIIGDVPLPGGYGLPQRSELTATQALAYAGGPLPTAKTSKAFIMRRNAVGEPEAIEFDFARIIAGKDPDVMIQQNDILFVPVSNIKTVGIGLLNLGPRMVQQFLIF